MVWFDSAAKGTSHKYIGYNELKQTFESFQSRGIEASAYDENHGMVCIADCSKSKNRWHINIDMQFAPENQKEGDEDGKTNQA